MPSEDGDDRDRDRDRAFSFRLPPLRVPDFFPDEFRVSLPIPGRTGRRVDPRVVWAACLAFDAADAALALTADAAPVAVARTLGGTALAAVVANLAGTIYAWEFAAVLFGYPDLTVVPTLTLLLALRVVR